MASFGISITIWVFSGIAGVNRYKVDQMTGIQDSNLVSIITRADNPMCYKLIVALQCLWIASWFNQAALSAVKIAILLFYKRIFVMRAFHIVAWTMIVLVAMWGILFLLVSNLSASSINIWPSVRL